MLVVLEGHGLGVFLCAVQLLEKFARVKLKVLILESQASKLSNTFITGPLPHCITVIPLSTVASFHNAALNHGNSSIMYLSSIHKAPTRPGSMMEKHIVHDSLSVKPCTFPSTAISYHPDIYFEYLRTLLQHHTKVSFAFVRSVQESKSTIRNLAHFHNDMVIRFKFQNQKPQLSDLSLSLVHWDGLPDWKTPELVHCIRIKSENSTPYIIELDSHPHHRVFQVTTNYTFFDLAGALIASNIITEHLNALLVDANLRWPRL